MADLLRKQKSPLMSYSTLINNNNCQNCAQLKEMIELKEYQIKNLLARERDLLDLVQGDSSYRNYRARIEEFEMNELKLKRANEQLQHDLSKSEHHN